MSRETSRPNQQIFEEASKWFVAFRGEDLDAIARQEFHAWLKRSPEHIRAYIEIAAVYADIPAPAGGRTPLELIASARSSPDINVVPLSSPGSAFERSQETRSSKRWRLASRAIAAVFVFAFVAGGVWLYAQRNTYVTGIGEQRSITLADGSIVELNARSKVHVAFRDRQRDLELLEGQALFRVAKDRNRPFVVHAGATSVRAVGTQFDVYRKSAGTTVTVLEGRVAVHSVAPSSERASGVMSKPTALDAPGGGARLPAPETAQSDFAQGAGEMFLVAGEQAIVTPTHAQKAKPANVTSAIAWTRHELVFDGTPLSEVVEEFRRHSTHRLVLDSPELANLRISGQYTSSSPESLLRFLSLQEGVVVTRVDGETHISKE
jgi:transmembrane sensor